MIQIIKLGIEVVKLLKSNRHNRKAMCMILDELKLRKEVKVRFVCDPTSKKKFNIIFL